MAVSWSAEAVVVVVVVDEWTRYAIKTAERTERMERRIVTGDVLGLLLLLRSGCP